MAGRKRGITVEERFWEKVALGPPDVCWLWAAGTRGTKLYRVGAFSIAGNDYPAHVVAWELTYGPVPDGWEVHHKCHRSLCCNPRHLEAMTKRHNLARRRWRVHDELFAEMGEAETVQVSFSEKLSWWLRREADERGLLPEEVAERLMIAAIQNLVTIRRTK